MSLNLEELANEGLIEEFESTPTLIKQAMDSSEKDLKTAKEVLKTGNFDWAFVIAYNSMLQAGRAFMFSFGYRPKGENKHLSVVKFASAEMPMQAVPLVSIFNKMRARRNKVVYEVRDTVSKSEAESAIKYAEEFIPIVKGLVVERDEA